MIGPGNEIAALKAAFVEGRLTKAELDRRVGQALAMYAELEAITADIPAAPPAPAAVTSRTEVARQAANKKMIQQGTAGVAALTFLLDAVLVIPRSPVVGAVAGVLLTCFVAVLTAGLLTLLSWAMDRRTARQPEQGSPPATGGQAAARPRAVRRNDDRHDVGEDPPHMTSAGRRRPPRLATTPV